MKHIQLAALVAVAMSMQSCITTLLTLEAIDSSSQPAVVVQPVVVTQPAPVPAPAPKPEPVHTIVANVHHADFLDLHAVAAAFSQANSIQQFEEILNSPAYMINNLDLNGDRCIDYIRVRESLSGYHHKYLLQAVLAAGWYVDVATIEVECTHAGVDYIKVIGGTSIYGANYVYQPVFCGRPPMFDHIHGSGYCSYSSPYDWNKYPTYYEKPKPVSKEHYHKYVDTYMSHNKYTQDPRHKEDTKPHSNNGQPASTKPQSNNGQSTATKPATNDRTRDVVTRTTTTRVNSTTGRVSSNKVDTRVNNSNGTTTRTVATTTVNKSGNTTTRTTTTVKPTAASATTTRQNTSGTTSSSSSSSSSTTNTRPQGGVRR